ncbi:MAG: hypothetical protein ABI968_15250, partial [Acidobacteriota bacterium]
MTADDESDIEDAALAAVADAILDGKSIDWTAAESGGSTDPGLTQQLRVLAGMAALHRTLSLGDPTTSSPDVALSGAARGSWGHLELLGKVGQGAFGEVFRAWDPHLNREVALKLFASGGTSRDADKRAWV